MPRITLPDDSVRDYPAPLSVMDVAADIGPGLAKATLAGVVDGTLVDASHVLDADARLAIVTSKSEEALPLIRHSTAHLMAQAIKQLFPETQVTIGPVVEGGFYYDLAREASFTPEDLEAIEARMTELAAADIPIERRTMARDDVIARFEGLGEAYKVEIARDIPAGETLSLYAQGDFTDLCRGPHVPSTGHLKAFKLTKLAGAYWRGDASNAVLQRIYGTAFATPKELKAHLHALAEAEKRDHRRIGRQQDLFHLQDEAPGMVFWHPKGWAIWQAIETYMRAAQRRHGYREIKTPQLVDQSLWQRSGHAAMFEDGMFHVEADERRFALKPMNCPCHVQVFNQGLRSYRELPLRLAEFGSCHRNEMSGALHGIMRVRGFTQDDAHVFCTEAQIQDEVAAFIDFLHEVYADFGFDEIIYRLSTRPPERVGSDADWGRAERALGDALDAQGLEWRELPGEGAFYGPKIEFSLTDCIGRVWQCGTMQVDFSMPGRLGASYVDEHGERQVPVMLHRAILGSFERFIGILIENSEGRLPFWLAPVQATVMTITDRARAFVEETAVMLQNSGFRVESDLRNEKIGLKIREATLQRVPYLLVAGDREVEDDTLAVRTREGKDLGTFSRAGLVEMLDAENAARRRVGA